MTIKECIDIVDNLKPNQYTTKEKVMWLSFIEAIIINEVLKTHEGYDGRYDMFEGYSEDKLSVKLIVTAPYDRLYTAYLKMKIDEENGETARYNNSAALYNTYMSEYKKYYNKTHMPLDVTKKVMSVANKLPMGNGLSDAEIENIVKELTYIITEQVGNAVSEDKIYDIVMKYMQNNVEVFRGKEGKPGKNGAPGKDGYSPIKGIDYTDGKNGKDGKDGDKGDDGYSPRVTISATNDGHTITIQDAYGVHTFDVANGKDGVNSDHNQNDETAPDYIKNRTHYEVPKVILSEIHRTEEETTMENGFDGICDVHIDKSLVEVGKEYKYTINGQSGTFVFSDEYMDFGGASGYVNGFGDTYNWQTNWPYYSTIDIVLYDGGEVKQLDEKYIPDTIARVSDVEKMIGIVNDELESILNGGVE